MRQIKSFISLTKRLLETTELYSITRREYKNDIIRVARFSDRISIRHLESKNQILFSTSTEHYVNFCFVNVVKFGFKVYETSLIDLSIEDKVDYFNYTVQNDPGMITLEDVKVLKEIFDLALKVLNNETN